MAHPFPTLESLNRLSRYSKWHPKADEKKPTVVRKFYLYVENLYDLILNPTKQSPQSPSLPSPEPRSPTIPAPHSPDQILPSIQKKTLVKPNSAIPLKKLLGYPIYFMVDSMSETIVGRCEDLTWHSVFDAKSSRAEKLRKLAELHSLLCEKAPVVADFIDRHHERWKGTP